MRGIWTALITPFTAKNQIDTFAYRRILQDQIAAGVTGVIPCGSTGEGINLSLDEKKLLIETCLKEVKNTGVKVFAGTGSASTHETLEFSKWAEQQGVDGLLIVTPYYNKPSQAGLEAHFLAVAESVKCEIMLYNVPGRTGVSLSVETIVNLAGHPRIRSLKESSGKVDLTSEVLDSLSVSGRSMDLLSGDDSLFLPLLSIGAVGLVSVVSNLIPQTLVEIKKAFDEGNVEKARELHQRYFPLFKDFFIETNPVPIKFAMAYQGFCESHVRAPLAALSPENSEKLLGSLKRCDIQAKRFS